MEQKPPQAPQPDDIGSLLSGIPAAPAPQSPAPATASQAAPAAPAATPAPKPQERVQTTTLALPRERLTFGKILRFFFTLFLVVALPLAAAIGMGTYQLMFPTELVTEKTPLTGGYAFNDVVLTTADGMSLTAWHVPGRNPSDAAVLVLHGYPANKGGIIDRTAFLAEDYDLLVIDFRSFGGSTGAYTTYGAAEVQDALAGIDWLAAKGKTRIAIYGHSMGGAVALLAAQRSDKVTAVIAESSYADMGHVLERAFEYLGPLKSVCAQVIAFAAQKGLGLDLASVSPVSAASSLRIPVLLVQVSGDPSAPLSDALLLRDALSANPKGESFYPVGTSEEQSLAFTKKLRAFLKASFAETPLP